MAKQPNRPPAMESEDLEMSRHAVETTDDQMFTVRHVLQDALTTSDKQQHGTAFAELVERMKLETIVHRFVSRVGSFEDHRTEEHGAE